MKQALLASGVGAVAAAAIGFTVFAGHNTQMTAIAGSARIADLGASTARVEVASVFERSTVDDGRAIASADRRVVSGAFYAAAAAEARRRAQPALEVVSLQGALTGTSIGQVAYRVSGEVRFLAGDTADRPFALTVDEVEERAEALAQDHQ